MPGGGGQGGSSESSAESAGGWAAGLAGGPLPLPRLRPASATLQSEKTRSRQSAEGRFPLRKRTYERPLRRTGASVASHGGRHEARARTSGRARPSRCRHDWSSELELARVQTRRIRTRCVRECTTVHPTPLTGLVRFLTAGRSLTPQWTKRPLQTGPSSPEVYRSGTSASAIAAVADLVDDVRSARKTRRERREGIWPGGGFLTPPSKERDVQE
jgi:hypothetical protein